MNLRLVAILLLIAGCQAHDRVEGQWNGFAFTPAVEPVRVSIDVAPVADSLEVKIKMPQGDLPLYGFQLVDDRVSFQLSVAGDIQFECRMRRDTDGIYKGGCKDTEENVAPMILAPPGDSASIDAIDLDKAFEVWGLSRVDYEEEHFGRRKSQYQMFQDLMDAQPEDRLVSVNGRSMNLVEMGDGPVTVVLESGLGDDHLAWLPVQTQLQDDTRVVSYDRAGLGLSDASDAPRTPPQVADELYALLQAAGVPGPYVLVGHDVGALYVRAFAARHADVTAGLVLVDPAQEDLGTRWAALAPEAWAAYLNRQHTFLSTLPGAIGAEFDAYNTILDQGTFDGASVLPDVPVIVITGAEPAESPQWPGETQEGIQAKRDAHEAWVDRLPTGTHLTSETAGSYVHQEDPDVVVEAVRRVLQSVTPSS